MTITAIILAAGRGQRAGGDVAKQWAPLAGRRVIDHTLAAFAAVSAIRRLVIVLPPDEMARADEFIAAGHLVASGGDARAHSVRNGLAALADGDTDRVLIHDVARPCVSADLIGAVIAALAGSPGAAPALAVTDALWTGAQGQVTGTRDRAGLFRAQTPQGFHFAAIRAAHAAHPGGAADDVEVARAAGMAVAIVPGDEDNLKITLPGDFVRAERILRTRNGYQAG